MPTWNGNFGEHDRAAVAAAFLDMTLRALQDRAAPGSVGAADPGGAEDRRPRREIGAEDMLHQPLGGDRGVGDEGAAGGDHLAEIVRRDVGRHADRDSARAVDEQVREARRQHLRLAFRRVVVGREVDGVLVGIAKQEVGDLGEARFGVAHRRGRIGSIDPKLPWPSIGAPEATSFCAIRASAS